MAQPGYSSKTLMVLSGEAVVIAIAAIGGALFSLADSAFAFACNSYDELTVASGFAIDFLAPGLQNDVLTARCVEVSKAGRTGVYDSEVTNQNNERIAVFRGRSYTLKGKPAVTPT